MPNIDFGIQQTYVTIRGIRGSLSLWQVHLSGQMRCLQRQCQKANLHKQIQCLQRHSHHSNSKYICFIYLKPGSWFSRPWFSFSESNYPRSWIGKHRIWPSILCLHDSWHCLCKHWNVISTYTTFKAWNNLCKHRIVGTQFFLLGCSALKPSNEHLRSCRIYGTISAPAMRQWKE